jgi:hypothetical protein
VNIGRHKLIYAAKYFHHDQTYSPKGAYISAAYHWKLVYNLLPEAGLVVGWCQLTDGAEHFCWIVDASRAERRIICDGNTIGKEIGKANYRVKCP